MPVTQIVKIYNTSKATVIKWTPVKKASGYNVYRKTSSSEWKHIAYVDGGESKTFTDNSVRTMKEYFYCVKAVRGKTVGDPSDVKAYKFIPLHTLPLLQVRMTELRYAGQPEAEEDIIFTESQAVESGRLLPPSVILLSRHLQIKMLRAVLSIHIP